MGFGPRAFRKLQSCLVAAEAACSKGDLPVAAVDAKLVAVIGLAAAAVAAVVPAELATAVPLAPIAAIGATHPCRSSKPINENTKAQRLARLNENLLFNLANNIKHPSRP